MTRIVWILFFQETRHPGNRSAGADADHYMRYFAFRLLPDFRAGGVVVGAAYWPDSRIDSGKMLFGISRLRRKATE